MAQFHSARFPSPFQIPKAVSFASLKLEKCGCPGLARPGSNLLSLQTGSAWLGLTGPVSIWLGLAQLDSAWLGFAQHGWAWSVIHQTVQHLGS